MTTPTTVIFDLDDPLIRADANRYAAWYDHLAGYAAAIRPHNSVKVDDNIRSRAARFRRNPNVHDRGGHDLEVARRAIVGGALAQIAIAAPSLASEIADAFTAKRKQCNERYPDATQVLLELKSSGFALGLLTNGGLDSQRAKLERFVLSDFSNL